MTSDGLREPPATLFKALRQIGPGIILAGSIIGTGELLLTTGLGAEHGFVFLWLILLSCVIKVFVQVELGRYTLSSGKPTLAALDEMPGPRLGANWQCWWWLGMLLLTVSQLGAMEGGVGQAMHLLWPQATDTVVAKLEGFAPGWAAAHSRPSGTSVGYPGGSYGDAAVAQRRVSSHRVHYDHPGGRRHVGHRGVRDGAAVCGLSHYSGRLETRLHVRSAGRRHRRGVYARSASRASAPQSCTPIPTGASKKATRTTQGLARRTANGPGAPTVGCACCISTPG